MNIIEKMRDILRSFPKISEICNEIHIDFADPEPTSYGLSSMGDALISEDILGNQLRQHSFMLYSTFSAVNDYERLSNSGVLLELAQWLGQQIGAEVTHEIDGISYLGEIRDIRTENGQLIALNQENVADGVQYQLQIVVRYTVEVI